MRLLNVYNSTCMFGLRCKKKDPRILSIFAIVLLVDISIFLCILAIFITVNIQKTHSHTYPLLPQPLVFDPVVVSKLFIEIRLKILFRRKMPVPSQQYGSCFSLVPLKVFDSVRFFFVYFHFMNLPFSSVLLL